MFLDKILFDKFDRALIEHKILNRKHIIGLNIYRFFFVPRKVCNFCSKKIKKNDEIFIPGYGTIHSKCYLKFHKKYKRKEIK